MSDEQRARWNEIKESFVRTRRAGGKGDDPVARVTGALGGLDEALQRIQAAIGAAVAANAAAALEAKAKSGGADESLGPYLAKLEESIRTLGKPSKVELRVDDGTSAAAVSVVNIVREQSKMIERVIANLAELAKSGSVAPGLRGTRPAGPACVAAPRKAAAAPPAGDDAAGRAREPAARSSGAAGRAARRAHRGARRRRASSRASPRDLGGAGSIPRFDVALGASSPSNFYRGLDGDDVVMHGGVFVATYAKLPPIGAAVILGIELPGGNRFDVAGTVAWTQDELGEDSPAGFGARIASAPEDARAMIAQFVRHRQPLVRD